MKKVVTIGGGNGHSNMLKGIRKVFIDEIELTSIVSMSDDGRTTGKLMKIFQKEKGKYFPPPGDLRKCLYSLSKSKFAHTFEILLETGFKTNAPINSLNILEYFQFIVAQKLHQADSIFGEDEEIMKDFLKGEGKFHDTLKKGLGKYFPCRLELEASIEGHKMGNILMANLAENMGSFLKMLALMHKLLKVEAQILPVTNDTAIIKAKTDSGEVIETQEAISDIAEYSGRIISLELCDNSKKAQFSEAIKAPIENADFIIIAPGDLYTSTIANFIIGGVKELIKNAKAKLIFVANNTNKGGETFGYSLKDFIEEIQKYLERNIDILVVNKKRVQLSFGELERLKSNISVQGGDYIYLTKDERESFEKQGIHIVEEDLIDRESLYKHDRRELGKTLRKLIV